MLGAANKGHRGRAWEQQVSLCSWGGDGMEKKGGRQTEAKGEVEKLAQVHMTQHGWPSSGTQNKGSCPLDPDPWNLTSVSGQASNRNLCRTWRSVSLTSSSPSRTPRQLRGPAPKGR